LHSRRERTPAPASLHVVESSALLPAIYRPARLGRWLFRLRVARACRLLRRNGARRIALYLWRPEFADALGARAHDVSCYHVDDDYSFSSIDQPNSPAEVALLGKVDRVIVHSQRLFRKKGGINPNTAIIPNGVDHAAFSSPCGEPADLRAIARPCVGYIGVIKKQLDLALMLELAQRCRQWSFVFVGPVGNLGDKAVLWERLTAQANVHVLGARPARELPAYAQHFDANVMCYEVNDYTHSIFPLKLTEYLSAGRPVVSSRVESVLAFSEVVQLASGAAEWEAALHGALQACANTAEAVARRRAAAQHYDWDLLVDRIAKLLLDKAE
jgi:glycosyltransferase involved in cell wall biosynthesis